MKTVFGTLLRWGYTDLLLQQSDGGTLIYSYNGLMGVH